MEKAVKQQKTLVAIQSEIPIIFMLYNTHKTHALVHPIMICYTVATGNLLSIK